MAKKCLVRTWNAQFGNNAPFCLDSCDKNESSAKELKNPPSFLLFLSKNSISTSNTFALFFPMPRKASQFTLDIDVLSPSELIIARKISEKKGAPPVVSRKSCQ